ncbi:dimethylarginine dimethylaminohydrolase family protein [Ulvibacter antarcticus]|uniref:arginine deiminase n=1 Tax=Ulvibacter antarcticus TaxID=442714 RepID=A0A3L9Z2K3_9FLAO|nr:arginine deiminase family protein [Ulvibacter antarcticus]RMA66370.1 N-dimethylarginine dimethylaminohydrolase [Ulvibacter antarcticus]
MKTTHHSEYLKLHSLFIKPAKNAFFSEATLHAQWEELNYLEQPKFNSAIDEYNIFEAKFLKEDIQIHHFPADAMLTIDSIYCRDASIATDFGMILCNMGKAGRKGEPEVQKAIYKSKNIPILGEIRSPGTLEGGDVAWLDQNTLAVGHTYRTNEEGISQLKNMLEPKGIEVIVAELPHFRGESDVFHLMSILSPVDKDLAVVYSPLMPIKFRNELLKRGFKLVEVPEDEFDSMGCNVLAISPRKCMMVAGNPKTQQRLLDAGCSVFAYKGEEISVKGGGGPTCLTRPMLRSL